jgi:uncharacterized protein YcfJ
VTDSEQPDREPAASDETLLTEATVTVRRSPRYFNFMIVGAVLGAVLALILTYAFPANPVFGRAQVFGFLLLAGIAVGVAVGSLVALALGRLASRAATTVVADRLGGHSAEGKAQSSTTSEKLE